MKNKIKIILLMLICSLFFVKVDYVGAWGFSVRIGDTTSETSAGQLRDGMVDRIESDDPTEFRIEGADSGLEFFKKIKKFLYAIVFIVAIASIVWAGVRMSTANGSPEAFKKAWMHLLYVLIGTLIAFFAWALIYFILNINFKGW